MRLPAKVARTLSISAWVAGAEPIATTFTEERSRVASSSFSWRISASMVGTEVSHVAWWSAMARR